MKFKDEARQLSHDYVFESKPESQPKKTMMERFNDLMWHVDLKLDKFHCWKLTRGEKTSALIHRLGCMFNDMGYGVLLACVMCSCPLYVYITGAIMIVIGAVLKITFEGGRSN